MATEGILYEKGIATAKREEYDQLTMDSSCEEFCSCLLVCQYYNKRYGRLKEKQHKDFLMGDNMYTEKMAKSKTLLEDWKGPSSAQPSPIENK